MSQWRPRCQPEAHTPLVTAHWHAYLVAPPFWGTGLALSRRGRHNRGAEHASPDGVEGKDHMAEIDNRYAHAGMAARTDVAVDEGLRAYMLRVYNYMAAGVALTGLSPI